VGRTTSPAPHPRAGRSRRHLLAVGLGPALHPRPDRRDRAVPRVRLDPAGWERLHAAVAGRHRARPGLLRQALPPARRLLAIPLGRRDTPEARRASDEMNRLADADPRCPPPSADEGGRAMPVTAGRSLTEHDLGELYAAHRLQLVRLAVLLVDDR